MSDDITKLVIAGQGDDTPEEGKKPSLSVPKRDVLTLVLGADGIRIVDEAAFSKYKLEDNEEESAIWGHPVTHSLIETAEHDGRINGAIVSTLQYSLLYGRKANQETYQTPYNTKSSDMVAAGMLMIIGTTGAGKTAYTRNHLLPALAEQGYPIRYFTFGEDTTYGENGIMDTRSLLVSLASALLEPGPGVIAIDSMRFKVYEKSLGGTGEGGMNMHLFAQLTALDEVAKRCGKLLIMTMNPMDIKEELYGSLVRNLESGIKGVISFAYDAKNQGSQRQVSVQLRSPFGRHTTQFVAPVPSPKGIGQTVRRAKGANSVETYIPGERVDIEAPTGDITIKESTERSMARRLLSSK